MTKVCLHCKNVVTPPRTKLCGSVECDTKALQIKQQKYRSSGKAAEKLRKWRAKNPSPRKGLRGPQARPISYDVDENGCWNCTSHCTDRGYPVKSVYRNGKQVRTRICRLVCLEKYGTIPQGYEVRHKCDNPLCINPSHLLLGTKQQNQQDKYERNRQAKGVQHGRAVLSEEQVTIIRNDTRVQQAIAKTHGISQSNVNSIKKRRIWRHIL